jgi:O-antigen ligase
VYLIARWKPWLLALAPLALLGGLAVSPDAVSARFRSIFHSSDNQFRLVIWSSGLEMVKAHPWLGVGPEQINRQSVERYLPPGTPRPLPTGYYGHLHNIYLHYAAERGIPAMLILVWMLLMMLADFQKALRGLPPGAGDRRFILNGATAVVLAAMVAGFFELNLGDSEVLTMFLVAAGCGYVATEKEAAIA